MYELSYVKFVELKDGCWPITANAKRLLGVYELEVFRTRLLKIQNFSGAVLETHHPQLSLAL